MDWAPTVGGIAMEMREMSTQKNLKFGEAVELLKRGNRVCRAGWNGRGMWLALILPGSAMYTGGGVITPMLPCIGMYTAAGDMQPGWLASQADILEEDWEDLGL